MIGGEVSLMEALGGVLEASSSNYIVFSMDFIVFSMDFHGFTAQDPSG